MKMKWTKLLVAGTAALAMQLSGGIAGAQECLLTPVAVPGLNGLPYWYSAPGKVERSELDDPRWAGGPLRSMGSNASSSAGFRVLRDGNLQAIYLPAITDANGVTHYDAVW